MKFKQKGFTLIELIIVIAIIALLAAATFVAVNPGKRIGDANNAQRWSDISALADAWQTYTADNSGTNATTVTNGVTYAIATTTKAHTEVCSTANPTGDTGATTTTAIVDMSALVSGGYVGQIPSDPTTAGTNTQYYFYTDSTGVVKVGACNTYEASGATQVAIEVIR